jgi:hypothetical protein
MEEKGRTNSWRRERIVGQERAEQFDIWTEWKRQIGNNRF